MEVFWELVNLGSRRLFRLEDFSKSFMNRKYLILLNFVSLCKENLYILRNLYVIFLNLKTPNFISFFRFYLISFSLIYLVLLFFITWLSFSSPLKVIYKYDFLYLVTSWCLKLLPFENFFCCLKLLSFF